mgnify:CR=1 FL=1
MRLIEIRRDSYVRGCAGPLGIKFEAMFPHHFDIPIDLGFKCQQIVAVDVQRLALQVEYLNTLSGIAQIHLAAAFIDHQRACGVPPNGGDVVDKDLPLLIDAVSILIAIAKDARTVPDIEIAVEELQRLGSLEVCRHHDRFIRYTVTIPIRQRQDLIGAHVGHMKNAIVIEGHEAGTIEGLEGSVDAGAESRR